MSVTPEYGWPLIEPTDFVTDLPADFELFADAVDETVKDLNPGTTAGDLDYYTSSTAKARLGIGTAGQVLRVNSGATAPEWATPAAGGANWSLVNTGGTALTGAQTITVSGISGADKIMVLVDEASSVNAESNIAVRFNSDTASNYFRYGLWNFWSNTYGPSVGLAISGSTTNIVLGKTSSDADTNLSGYLLLSGGNSSGVKIFNSAGQGRGTSGSAHSGYVLGGHYNSASTISSVSILSTSGNFDNGTVFIYTSA